MLQTVSQTEKAREDQEGQENSKQKYLKMFKNL